MLGLGVAPKLKPELDLAASVVDAAVVPKLIDGVAAFWHSSGSGALRLPLLVLSEELALVAPNVNPPDMLVLVVEAEGQ